MIFLLPLGAWGIGDNPISDWLKDGLTGMLEGIVRWVGTLIFEITFRVLEFCMTWWMTQVTPPDLVGGAQPTASEQILTNTLWLAAVVGILSTTVALVRIGRTNGREGTDGLVMSMVYVVIFTGIGLSVITTLLTFSHQLSPWLLHQISGSNDASLTELAGGKDQKALATSLASIPMISIGAIFALLTSLAGLATAVMVVFTYAATIILAGLLPVFAASYSTEKGKRQFEKVLGWLVAAILFKPVASIIFGAGLRLLHDVGNGSGDPASKTLSNMMFGAMICFCACMALPMMLRLIVPAMSAGSQGKSAGQVAAAGLGIAGGAVALAATGGLAAAAGASAGVATGVGGGGAAAGGFGASAGSAAATGGAVSAAGADTAAGAGGTAGTVGGSPVASPAAEGASASRASSENANLVGAPGADGGLGSSAGSGDHGVPHGTGASGSSGTPGTSNASNTSSASGASATSSAAGSTSPVPVVSGGSSSPAPSGAAEAAPGAPLTSSSGFGASGSVAHSPAPAGPPPAAPVNPSEYGQNTSAAALGASGAGQTVPGTQGASGPSAPDHTAHLMAQQLKATRAQQTAQLGREALESIDPNEAGGAGEGV